MIYKAPLMIKLKIKRNIKRFKGGIENPAYDCMRFLAFPVKNSHITGQAQGPELKDSQ